MHEKFPWTKIEPLFHGFRHLTERDVIYYHIEYIGEGYQASSDNSWVSNYKRGIEYRNKSAWYYKEEAVRKFADLIVETPPVDDGLVLLAGPTSKRRNSPLFDSRNEDVLRSVHHATGIPISFNLEAVMDSEPVHFQPGYRSPEKLIGHYHFTPFENVPSVVYIVDDVITSGSHFVVWRDLIHDVHPGLEVRGLYLARTVRGRLF